VFGDETGALRDRIEHLDSKPDALTDLTQFYSQAALKYRGGDRFI
jgi:hypothetical protein